MKSMRAARFLSVCQIVLGLWFIGVQPTLASDLTAARGTVSVEAYNGIAATADRSGVVRLFNVASPDRPVLLSTYTLPVNLDGVALAGNSLLVAGQGGIQILDISDPASPRLRSNVSLNAEATVVKAAGNLGYSAYENNVVLFDIATGKVLDQHSYSKFAVNDIAIWADSVYILSADAGSAAGVELTKLSVQDSLGSPLASWTSTSSTTTGRLSLHAADNLLYIGSVLGATNQTPGLEILRDRGTSFQIVGSPASIGADTVRPTGVNLLAFTTAGNQGERSGVGVLDVSDPSKTNQLLRTVEAAGTAYNMILYGGYAYVAAGDAGLQVVKFATPNGTRSLPAITLNSGGVLEASPSGKLLRLTAEVAAADQIRQVDFYLNGKKVASDGNYPFEYRFFQPAAEASAPLVVSVCSQDVDGNSSCTTPQDLNSKNSNTLTVVSVTPTSGAHVEHATKMSLAAQFSQALDTNTVTLKNVSVVQLAKNSTKTTPVSVATVSYQSGSRSIAIQPKSPMSTGSYRVTLSSAIRSTAGKTLAADYSWTFNVQAATVTWTSLIGGNWNTATNWSGGAVPANGDSVVINNTPGVPVTLNSGSPEIENLTVGAGNTLEISGGALSVVGTGSIDTLDLSSGSIGGPGTVTIATKMAWTNGGVTGTLTIPVNATMQVSVPFDGGFYLSGGTINNSGTVTQTFAGTPGAYTGFQLSQGGVINNLVGGVWNVNGDVWIYPTDGSAVAFNNAGTFNKIGGTNTSAWSVPFGGVGAVNIQTGTITFNGKFTGMFAAPIAINPHCVLNYGQGGTLDGSQVTGTGTLNFTASTQVSTAYTFAGITQIQGGTITFQKPASIATLNLINGAMAGPGPVTITGSMDWTNGGISTTLTIPAKSTLQVNTPFDGGFYLSGGVINNSGTVTQSFAGTPGNYTGFQLSQGGVINNLAGGVWNVNGDVWVYPTDSSAVSFNNAGTFNKVGGTSTTFWSIPYNGAGAFNLQSGTFTLNGHYTGILTAPIAISANCVLNYGQGGTLGGSAITGAGTFNFTASTQLSTAYTFAGLTQIQAGTIVFQKPTSIAKLNLINGAMAGPGPVTITGSMDWTNGGITTTLIIPAKSTLQVNTVFDGNFYLSGGTINNSGTVTQTFAGTPGNYTGFQLSQGGVINNLAGGVWNVNGDVWVYPTDSSAVSFNNAGTFNKVGGTNTTIWSIPYNGAGAFNLQSGTFTLNGHYTGLLAAPIAIGANCVLNYGQGGTLDGSAITGTGTFNFTASTELSTAYKFAGLTQIVSGTIAFQKPTTIATLNLFNGAMAGPGPVTITGTMDWTNGGISTTLIIPAKSTLLVNTPFDGNFYLSGGTINNSGTVTQTFAGTPGNYTGFQLAQGGVINNLAGGVWNVNGDVWVYSVDSSAVSFNNAGTFNKSGGTNTSVWSIPYNGAGAFNLQSGTFTLNGHYSGMLAAPIAIGANCVLNYGQGGTLDGSAITGTGTFNFTASTELSTAYTFAGLTQIVTGTINFQKPTTLASLNLINGALAGPGPVTVTGAMDWTNGGVTGNLVIPVNATLQVKTPFDGTFYLSGGTINNSGTVTQSFAGTPGNYTGFQFSQSGTVNNLKGGVWNVVSDVWVYPTDSSNNVFNNAGTFNKTGGTAVSYWSVCFQGSGTVNINSGTIDFNGFCPASQLGGTINIASSAALTYAQEGTLTNGSISGAGTLNLNTSGSGGGTATNAISGTFHINVPANVLAGTLAVDAGATLNANNLTLTNNASLQVAGTTSLGKLNVDVTAGNPSGSTVGGAGSITVSGTLTWTSGSVNVTGVFNANNMSLSANSSMSFTLGSVPISVQAELTLNGDLTLNITSSNPTVGTIFQVLNFANNYLGKFANVSIPVLGNNEVLNETLNSSGLSFTVAQKQ